jgi:hypothetical protein
LKFFSYEYVNSHVCCNRVKTGTKWIKYDEDDEVYVKDENNLTKSLNLIKLIKQEKQYDCNNIKAIEDKNFIKTRTEFITSNFLNPLLEIINKDKLDYGNLFDLCIRIRQITALNKNIGEIATALLTGKAPSKVIQHDKMYDINDAKLVFKRTFKKTEDIFYHVFESIFSQLNPSFITVFFKGISNRPLKNDYIRIAFKIYNDTRLLEMITNNQISISDTTNIILSNIKQIIENTFREDFLNETVVINLINYFVIILKEEYRKILIVFINHFINNIDYINSIDNTYKNDITKLKAIIGKTDNKLNTEKEELVKLLEADENVKEILRIDITVLSPSTITQGGQHKMIGGNSYTLEEQIEYLHLIHRFCEKTIGEYDEDFENDTSMDIDTAPSLGRKRARSINYSEQSVKNNKKISNIRSSVYREPKMSRRKTIFNRFKSVSNSRKISKRMRKKNSYLTPSYASRSYLTPSYASRSYLTPSYASHSYLSALPLGGKRRTQKKRNHFIQKTISLKI